MDKPTERCTPTLVCAALLETEQDAVLWQALMCYNLRQKFFPRHLALTGAAKLYSRRGDIMFQHHKESIKNLIKYFENDSTIISIVLGGSVAKNCAHPDSDIDAIVVVTDEKYTALEKEYRLAECIFGHCTYEKGYFDIKYTTLEYLKAVAKKGSEPSRNAFVSSMCIFGSNEEVFELIKQIPVFQKQEKNDKMLTFYSALNLNKGYFWSVSNNNIYLKTKVASDIVLFALRLILQNNEVLFPCHKALLETIDKLENKPQNITKKVNCFLASSTDESKNELVNTVLEFIDYTPPDNYAEVLTRFIVDNELWWYKQRSTIAEW